MEEKKSSKGKKDSIVQAKKLITLLKKTLSPDVIDKSMIFVDSSPHKEGSEVMAGRESFTYPYDGFMVFVDLEPRANWSHDCLYLFVSSDLKNLTELRASFPPYFGEVPETYTVLLRYGNTPDDVRNFSPY